MLAVDPGDAGVPSAEAPAAPATDTSLEAFRTPFDALTERAIGMASRAVRFDWRKTRVGFGVVGSQILELNNYSSARVGGFARTTAGSFMLELAVTRVITWASASAEQLALTPYRQFGRASRVELDFNVGYPLAEGVATLRPGVLPAAEFVFSANAGLRYLYYPGSLNNMTPGAVMGALFAPRLGETELENMKAELPPAMQLDPSRYQLLVGFSLDVYFQPGLFVTPRAMMGVPVLSAAGGGIGFWWELSLAAGWAL